VYTVFHTYETTKVLNFVQHIHRLEQSARGYGVELRVDMDRVRTALRELILRANWGDVRCRVALPLDEDQRENVLISIEPFFGLSQHMYDEGVACVTLPGVKREAPSLKSGAWQKQKSELQQELPLGVHTGLLLDDEGYLLEGLDCNLFGFKDGVLYTAVDQVLQGVTQRAVVTVSSQFLTIRETPLHIDDLTNVHELFITSSSRGVLPVVKVDDIVIGDGEVGPLTKQIAEAFRGWLDRRLEEL